jgi:CSLREA domain-containing protein
MRIKIMNKTHVKAVPLPARHPLGQAIALAIALGAGGAQAANITVNSAADAVLPANDGTCTLREAIRAANTNTAVDACAPGTSGLDTIQFNAGLGTITLTSGQLDIT